MPRELSIGTMIGEYRIKKVLGQGGFGITYLAHDENLARDVAIKEYFPKEFAHRDDGLTVIPNQDDQDRVDFDWGMKHFVEEARSLTRFKHRNIVGAIRFLRENGTAYLVMEYCDGESLESLVRMKGPLPAADLMPIVEQLLDGLDEVHRARLLHLDVKPSNIFVKRDGTVVLLDFGSARQAISSHTKSVKIASAGYGAIEQESADVDSGKLGAWTDVYGLGATLYRLMTGNRPHQATARLLEDSMPSLKSAVGPGYSAGLIEAVSAALRIKPQDRSQSIAEFRKILDYNDKASPKEIRASPKEVGEPVFVMGVPRGGDGLPWAPFLALLGGFVVVMVWVINSDQSPGSGEPTPVELPTASGDDWRDLPIVVREAYPGGVVRCPPATEKWSDCYGVYTFENGNVYRSMWKDDKPHGVGEISSNNGRYAGELKEGLAHGKGVLIAIDGTKFDGNFRNGKRHGSGTEYSSTGSIVRRGNWRDGTFLEDIPPPRVVPPSQPATKDLYIEVTNNTGEPIFYLYVRPTGVTSRGADRLGASKRLERGAAFTVSLPQSTVDYYDVIACDIYKDEYIVSSVNAVTSDAPIDSSHRTFNKCR